MEPIQSTGEATSYDPTTWKAPDIPLDPAPTQEELKNSKTKKQESNVISPHLLMDTFVRYDQNSAILDYKKKYVGQTRVDNSGNPFTPTNLLFTASATDTWNVSVTVTSTTKGEITAIIGKVDQTISVGGTYSRGWQKGYSYGSSTSVPPKRIGTINAIFQEPLQTGVPSTKSRIRSTIRTFTNCWAGLVREHSNCPTFRSLS